VRSRKKILLVSASEERASVLSFKLTTWGFSVTVISCAADALALLAAGSYELLLCELPLNGVETLIDQANEINDSMRTMVLLDSRVLLSDSLHAHAVVWKSPCAEELLDRVKRLTASKRGPREHKPIFPAAVFSREERRLA
jgi:CheY-like chemotaxis protein